MGAFETRQIKVRSLIVLRSSCPMAPSTVRKNSPSLSPVSMFISRIRSPASFDSSYETIVNFKVYPILYMVLLKYGKRNSIPQSLEK